MPWAIASSQTMPRNTLDSLWATDHFQRVESAQTPAMQKQMRILSNVAFPALYQTLFSYFLVIGFVGSPIHGAHSTLIILAAAVGIPLTARFNLKKLGSASKRNFLMILQPMLAALVLPMIQLGVFLTLPK